MESIINYIGKKKIDIDKYRIKDSEIFCEVFGGSFNTGLNILNDNYKGDVIYNDINSNLVDIWRWIKYSSEAFYSSCAELDSIIESISNNIEGQIKIIETWRHSKNSLQRAAGEWIYFNYKTVNGMSFKHKDIDFLRLDGYLVQILLNDNKVQLYNKHFKELLSNSNINCDKSFIFLDPPYVDRESRYYSEESHHFNHDELCECVKSIEGRFLLTYNKTDKILDMYKEYYIEDVVRPMFGKEYHELYITNFKV